MRVLLGSLIVLFILLQFDLWVGEGSLATVWQLEQAVDQQLAENKTLQERNSALAGEVKDLKKGMQAIEERARSELGMIKQGETFFQIVDEK